MRNSLSKPKKVRRLAASLGLLGAVIVMVTANTSASSASTAAVSAPASYSLFADSTQPTSPADPEKRSVELGVKFRSDVDGTISAIRYYKTAASTASNRGTLWAEDGSVLARASFDQSSGSGWKTAALSNPVAITAGKLYVASYTAPDGQYASDQYSLGRSKTVTRNNLTALAGVYNYSLGYPDSSWNDSNYYADVVFTPKAVSPTTTAISPPKTTATTSSRSTTPTTTAPSSTTGQATQTSSGGSTSGAFPDASNTGVPSGVALTTYTGPCTVTVANTAISGKQINCDLIIKASGVSVVNSRIDGRLVSNTTGASVTVTDSEINGGNQETFPSVSYQNLTLTRVEVVGGQHSVQCSANCVVKDSWLHNQYIAAGSLGHVNAFISNGGSGFTLIHNTLHCTVQPTGTGGGCTADASFFGDFAVISNAKIDGNLFKANSTGAGYCIQAGYNPGKAYPNATGVVVTNNVFERGPNNKCGIYGPATAFRSSDPTSVWSGNKFDDGVAIPAP